MELDDNQPNRSYICTQNPPNLMIAVSPAQKEVNELWQTNRALMHLVSMLMPHGEHQFSAQQVEEYAEFIETNEGRPASIKVTETEDGGTHVKVCK